MFFILVNVHLQISALFLPKFYKKLNSVKSFTDFCRQAVRKNAQKWPVSEALGAKIWEHVFPFSRVTSNFRS